MSSLPNPTEWEVTDTRLKAACRKLLPHVTEFRQALIDSEGEHGVYGAKSTREELAAYDEFIAACREEL